MQVTIFGAAACAAAAVFCAPPAGAQPRDDAVRTLNAMHAALGGAALDRWQTLRLQGIGRRNLLEQSVRPEGPWLVDTFTFDETLDVAGERLRRMSEHRGYVGENWFDQTRPEPEALVFIDGIAQLTTGGQTAFRAATSQDVDEELSLGPFALVRTALAAPDLRPAPARVVNGFAQPVVAFSWHGIPVEVVVNATTSLPVEVDFTRTRPYDVFWNVWGDVAERMRFESYNEEPGGIHLPREIDIERNGLPDTRLLVTSMVPAPPATFGLDAAVRSASTRARAVDDIPFGGAEPRPAEIAPDVTLVPGSWNVSFVVQSDGVVMIEAPISSAYAEGAIAFARSRWPSLPLKAVVTTSDAWPHLGGLRAAVAHGIPIYGPHVNRPIVERLVAAPHRERPDALARSPRPLDYRDVAARTTLGTGRNALVLAPYATPTGERQMMVYVPGAKLLYTSDLFQPVGKTWFTPQAVDECVRAVRRERFDVTTAFGMHYAPTPWSALIAAQANAERAKT